MGDTLKVDTVQVGVIGCGNISPQYLKWMPTFDILDVVALADLDLERARAWAAACRPASS